MALLLLLVILADGALLPSLLSNPSRRVLNVLSWLPIFCKRLNISLLVLVRDEGGGLPRPRPRPEGPFPRPAAALALLFGDDMIVAVQGVNARGIILVHKIIIK